MPKITKMPEIPEIRVEAPKVHEFQVPKARAGRPMSKPAAESTFPKPKPCAKKTTDGKIERFRSDAFSNESGVKKIKTEWKINLNFNLAILRALIKTDGDRNAVMKDLGITRQDIRYALWDINDCPESLKFYADKLGVSVKDIDKVSNMTAATRMRAMKKSLNPIYVKVLQALIEAEGNQTAAAGKLNKVQSQINQYVRKLHEIFQLDPALAEPYAAKLGVSVEDIITICDPNALQKIRTTKLKTEHYLIMRAMLETTGDIEKAAEILKKKSINTEISKIYTMTDEELQPYALKLGVSAGYLRLLCEPKSVRGYFDNWAGIDSSYRIALTHKINPKYVRFLRALFKTGGDQKETARILNRPWQSIGTEIMRFRNTFRQYPTIAEAYAVELGISVNTLKTICDGMALYSKRRAKRRMMKAK